MAKAVGLQVPPRVQLNFSASMRSEKKRGNKGKQEGWQVRTLDVLSILGLDGSSVGTGQGGRRCWARILRC